MKTIIALAALIALTGCALNRPYITEETTTTQTNGVASTSKRLLKLTSFAMWPAETDVSKQKASAGKTLSTGVEEIRASGGGTNVVATLRELKEIMQMVSP